MTRRLPSTDWQEPRIKPQPAGRLMVRASGSGAPPILLLHGLVGSGRYWGRQFERLADQHSLIVPDLLGFGGSMTATGPFTVEGHVAALLESLDHLGVESPLTIGAHSMGSVIALGLARAQPDRVRAVVTFGPPLYPDAAIARKHVAAGGMMERAFVLPGRLSQATCEWMCRHKLLARRLAPLLNPTLPAAIARDAVDHSWPSYSESLSEVILSPKPSRWLADVNCPVSLVVGARDPVVDPSHLEELARTMRAAHLETWPGDHHLPLRMVTRCLQVLETASLPSSA